MTKINSAMRTYLSENSRETKDFSVEDFVSKILDNTKPYFDFILYCPTNDVFFNQIDIEKIYKFFGDKTGYEASVNEVSIGNGEYNPSQIIELSQKLINGLNSVFSNRNFCVIVSVDEKRTNVRFHTIRSDEPLWCDIDVEKYQEPVLIEFSE